MTSDFTGASYLILEFKEMTTVTNEHVHPLLLKALSLHHWHFFMITAAWEFFFFFFCHVSSKRRAGRQHLGVFRADKEPKALWGRETVLLGVFLKMANWPLDYKRNHWTARFFNEPSVFFVLILAFQVSISLLMPQNELWGGSGTL